MMVFKLIAEWEMEISNPELSKSRRATTISNHELILTAIDGTIGVNRRNLGQCMLNRLINRVFPRL